MRSFVPFAVLFVGNVIFNCFAESSRALWRSFNRSKYSLSNRSKHIHKLIIAPRTAGFLMIVLPGRGLSLSSLAKLNALS